MISIFTSSGYSLLKELEQQNLSGDQEGMRETSHKITGTAKHLGLERMALIAEEIQQKTMTEHNEDFVTLIRDINQVFICSLDALEYFKSKIKSTTC